MARHRSPAGAEDAGLHGDVAHVRRRRRLRRGVYLLPSAFTMGNIFLGFWAIVDGLRGEFGIAALAVFGAGLLDGVDGRIARLTGTESEFGKEFDSLADVITFGVTPALLAYLWGLQEFPRVGWLVPLYFVVCGATRLARFNVQTKVADSRYFAGLPIPAAAGTVVSVLFYYPDREWRTWLSAAVLVGMAIVGTLMVSTFRYRSFKKLDLRQRRSYRAVLPLALIVLLIALRPHLVLMIIALSYAASGPLEWAVQRLRGGHRPPAVDVATVEAAPAGAASAGRVHPPPEDRL
jgi:CDP-diacylglycerol--serine O-phosphatidyltransferase